jgi:hypothetical protein
VTRVPTVRAIRKPDGGKYIPPPQCEWHLDRLRPCESSMVYANGKPFLYRLLATVKVNGAVIANHTLVLCQKHLEEEEGKARGSESIDLEWELICETDSQARRR